MCCPCVPGSSAGPGPGSPGRSPVSLTTVSRETVSGAGHPSGVVGGPLRRGNPRPGAAVRICAPRVAVVTRSPSSSMAGRRQSNPTPRRHAKAPAESRCVVSPMGHLLRSVSAQTATPASRRRRPTSLPHSRSTRCLRTPRRRGTPLPRALPLSEGAARPRLRTNHMVGPWPPSGAGRPARRWGLTVFHVKHRTEMPLSRDVKQSDGSTRGYAGARSPRRLGCPHRGPTTRSGYLPPSRAHSQGPRAQRVVGPPSDLGDDPTRMPSDLTAPRPSWWSGLRGRCGVRRGQGADRSIGPTPGGRANTGVPLTTSSRTCPQPVRSSRRPGADHGPRARTTATTHPGPPVRGAKNAARRRHTFHVKHEVMSRVRHGPLRLSTGGVGSGLARQPTASLKSEAAMGWSISSSGECFLLRGRRVAVPAHEALHHLMRTPTARGRRVRRVARSSRSVKSARVVFQMLSSSCSAGTPGQRVPARGPTGQRHRLSVCSHVHSAVQRGASASAPGLCG